MEAIAYVSPKYGDRDWHIRVELTSLASSIDFTVDGAKSLAEELTRAVEDWQRWKDDQDLKEEQERNALGH